MRFAFLADVHLSSRVRGATMEAWLSEWLAEASACNDVDHLVVCGDIAGSLSFPILSDDFRRFQRLLRRHGWYHGRGATVVPGNHDVRGAGVLSLLHAEPALQRMLPALFEGRIVHTPRWFPIVKRFHGVHLVGLDSASGTGLLAADTGLLGRAQLRALRQVLSRRAVHAGHVILAMHHPPLPRGGLCGGLDDADGLWAIVHPRNTDLIVCGHDHRAWEREINGVPVIAVGALRAHRHDTLLVDAVDGPLRWFWRDMWA